MISSQRESKLPKVFTTIHWFSISICTPLHSHHKNKKYTSKLYKTQVDNYLLIFTVLYCINIRGQSIPLPR